MDEEKQDTARKEGLIYAFEHEMELLILAAGSKFQSEMGERL